jgi:hypothetical protein
MIGIGIAAASITPTTISVQAKAPDGEQCNGDNCNGFNANVGWANGHFK